MPTAFSKTARDNCTFGCARQVSREGDRREIFGFQTRSLGHPRFSGCNFWIGEVNREAMLIVGLLLAAQRQRVALSVI